MYYRNARNQLGRLRKKLVEVEKLESQVSDTFTRYDAIARSSSPHRFWTSKEIKREIEHCQFYIRLRRKIRSGDVASHEVPVPDLWFEWANRHALRSSLGSGTEKMFEVRETYNDITFIETFFTEDFCEKYQYFTYGIGHRKDDPFGEERIVIKSRDYLRVKRLLTNEVLNLGLPKILLIDANYKNNGELRLVHMHDGRDLCYDGCETCNDKSPFKYVLECLYRVAGREKSVHIDTITTTWPKKRPPWYYWYPVGREVPGVDPPGHSWIRYTFNGTRHSTTIGAVLKLEKEVKNLFPVVPYDLKED